MNLVSGNPRGPDLKLLDRTDVGGMGWDGMRAVPWTCQGAGSINFKDSEMGQVSLSKQCMGERPKGFI